MISKDIIIKRLSIIKYLYKIGVDQSFQVETVASFSILSFHDSIEMFLKLLAEHRNIKSEKIDFMIYWTQFPDLTLNESMRNLNERRKNIKHKGILLSKSDIEACRVNTTDFFEQNTFSCFDVEFKDVSLFSLINKESIRIELSKAQETLNIGKYTESIVGSAVAFNHLLYLYEKNTYTYSRESPFLFGIDMHTYTWSHYTRIDNKLDDFIKEAAKSIESLQKALRIMSFGIDYKRYAKFNLLTPIVTKSVNGKYFVEIWNEKQWSKENCQYCIDFVLDACLKLQELDFDIRNIENKEVLDDFSEFINDVNDEEIQYFSQEELELK